LQIVIIVAKSPEKAQLYRAGDVWVYDWQCLSRFLPVAVLTYPGRAQKLHLMKKHVITRRFLNSMVTVEREASALKGKIGDIGFKNKLSISKSETHPNQPQLKGIEFKGVIFVRYLDHVLYNRASALVMKPQVRKAIGWLIYECEQYITLAWDSDDEPPSLRGGDPKASGLVLLRSDILELKMAPLQKISEWQLNSPEAIRKGEYAFRPSERKTQKRRKTK